MEVKEVSEKVKAQKEQVKKEKIKKFPKMDKRLLAAIGLALIILSTITIVFISTYMFILFTPFGQNLTALLTEKEDVIEERQILVTQEELNTITVVEEASPSVVSIAVSRITLSPQEGLIDTSSKIGTGFVRC